MSADVAFAWHEREGAFERLVPPWRAVRVVERTGGIHDGARVALDLGFPAGTWRLEHHDRLPGRAFHDRQLSGPFARYAHAHRFVPDGAGCVLEDQLEWRLPGAPWSGPADVFVCREFERLFAWRHRVTRDDLERARGRDTPRGAIGVTGASGFLGRELCAYLATQGHEVRRFVRGRAARAGEIAWDPARGELDPAALAGLHAVIHLSGAGIADEPWTATRRQELRDSRVRSTVTLARALAASGEGPRVFVSTSAVGCYGDRGDELLEESSAPGGGFLAELAREWEGAAEPAARAGVRVAHPRIGLVLWPRGGALAELLPIFRAGAGGPLGNGRAWWSWIGLHDLLEALLFAVDTETLAGPFNAVAPEPVRQRDWAAALGRVMSRPAWIPAPAFALRLLLGREKADEMLLASQRVRPLALARAGFCYRDPELEPLLARLLGRPRLEPAS